jgi:hypothetical protein
VLRAFSASIFIGAACFAFAADGGTHITVSGWVIDSACAYTKGLDKPIGVACAKACGRVATHGPPQIWVPHPYAASSRMGGLSRAARPQPLNSPHSTVGRLT